MEAICYSETSESPETTSYYDPRRPYSSSKCCNGKYSLPAESVTMIMGNKLQAFRHEFATTVTPQLTDSQTVTSSKNLQRSLRRSLKIAKL
jgi:hypothetical protein